MLVMKVNKSKDEVMMVVSTSLYTTMMTRMTTRTRTSLDAQMMREGIRRKKKEESRRRAWTVAG
jgi:hypothetical protein